MTDNSTLPVVLVFLNSRTVAVPVPSDGIYPNSIWPEVVPVFSTNAVAELSPFKRRAADDGPEVIFPPLTARAVPAPFCVTVNVGDDDVAVIVDTSVAETDVCNAVISDAAVVNCVTMEEKLPRTLAVVGVPAAGFVGSMPDVVIADVILTSVRRHDGLYWRPRCLYVGTVCP